MLELANTTITVMRGKQPNRFGDLTNVGTPLYGGVPAALVEKSSTTFDRAAQQRRTIRTIMCVLPDWADVTTDDTIRDEGTGAYYLIESIERQPSLGLPPDLILTLRSRSGVSVTTD